MGGNCWLMGRLRGWCLLIGRVSGPLPEVVKALPALPPVRRTPHALYSRDVGWEIEYTDEFEEWWATLTMNDQAAIDRAVQELAERGPALGRPWVDSITG